MRKRCPYGGHIVTYLSKSMSRNIARSMFHSTYTGVRARSVSHGKTNVSRVERSSVWWRPLTGPNLSILRNGSLAKPFCENEVHRSQNYSQLHVKQYPFHTDGTSIYLTRDIAGAIERYEDYKFDKMIYVVSAQQDMHLQQFFKVLDLMGFDWADRLEHVNYGLVMGMSTRKGTVVLLSDLIR